MRSRSFLRSHFITSLQLSIVDEDPINLPLPTDIGMSSNVGTGFVGKVSDVGYAWLSILGCEGLAISFIGNTNVGGVG